MHTVLKFVHAGTNRRRFLEALIVVFNSSQLQYAALQAQLRRRFLAARDAWLGELLAEVDDSDAYECVKQLTDLHRLHLFDIVMQYR